MSSGSGQLVKRQKSDTKMSGALTVDPKGRSNALIQSRRTAGGMGASVMELVGHTGEVFAARFDPTGEYIASGSMDRSILLWHSTGECENYGILAGHKGAVLDVHWSRDSRSIFSASADFLVASWDVESGTRTRRFGGHEDVVNCMDVSRRGEEVLVSGSDDGCIGLWDSRQKQAIDFIETDFPITAIALSEAGNELYSGSIDNDIKVWDIRKKTVAYSLLGHTDTITSLRISPDAQSLLSFSLDSTARTWDIRPFAPQERLVRTFDGAIAGIEKNLFKAGWSPDGKSIIAGGGDGSVTVWESASGKMLYKAPGHKGSVNDVGFSPVEDNVGMFSVLFPLKFGFSNHHHHHLRHMFRFLRCH